MSSNDLPKDQGSLSAWGYWQESVAAWTTYAQRTTQIMTARVGGYRAKDVQNLDQDAETLAGELLRALSDLNLHHWQNTARFLEGLPVWMQRPQGLTGTTLVEWFDQWQREANGAAEPGSEAASQSVAIRAEPHLLPAPDGAADDLTLIKGIGNKLSSQLNALGIFHFAQIAAWSEPQVRWVDEYLSGNGRVTRDGWVKQAQALAASHATIH